MSIFDKNMKETLASGALIAAPEDAKDFEQKIELCKKFVKNHDTKTNAKEIKQTEILKAAVDYVRNELVKSTGLDVALMYDAEGNIMLDEFNRPRFTSTRISPPLQSNYDARAVVTANNITFNKTKAKELVAVKRISAHAEKEPTFNENAIMTSLFHAIMCEAFMKNYCILKKEYSAPTDTVDWKLAMTVQENDYVK